MRREQMETLLKEHGVAEDKIKDAVDKIMDENGKDIEAEKTKTTAKDGELTKANETLKGLQETVKKFDGVDVEKLKNDMKQLETKYDTDVKAERQKADGIKKEYSLKAALQEAGVVDPDYLVFKHGGIEKFVFR